MDIIRENNWHPCVTCTQSLPKLAELKGKATGKALIKTTETMRTSTTKERLKYHIWICNKRTKRRIILQRSSNQKKVNRCPMRSRISRPTLEPQHNPSFLIVMMMMMSCHLGKRLRRVFSHCPPRAQLGWTTCRRSLRPSDCTARTPPLLRCTPSVPTVTDASQQQNLHHQPS